MTPISSEDEAVLIDCAKISGTLVRTKLGFYDEDLAQDACMAMVKAVHTFDRTSGVSLRSWLLIKANWQIIDSYRDRTRFRRRGTKIVNVSLDANELPEWYQSDYSEDDAFLLVENHIDNLALLNQHGKSLSSLSVESQDILSSIAKGETHLTIANRYDVTDTAISHRLKRIRNRIQKTLARPEASSIFSERDQEVIRLHHEGMKNVVIARLFHIHESRVSQILSRYRTRLASIVRQQNEREEAS